MANSERQPDYRCEAPALRRGALRYRAWQRLRGQRAFRRERGEGVFRHSAAALMRILPPWETTVTQTGEIEAQGAGSQGLGSQRTGSQEGGSQGVDKPANATLGTDPVADEQAGRKLLQENRITQMPSGRRLGVVASRKVGNAVVRNRAKRVFREIFRLNQHLLPADCDVLVIVRKDFMAAKRADLDALFADVARRARRAFGSAR